VCSSDLIEYFFRNVAEHMLTRGKSMPIHLILHGGEPLLLPRDYLRAVAALRDKYLGSNGILSTTAVQSNLFSLPEATLDLLSELNIELGISLDVFGDQRVDIKGRNSQEKVMSNLQRVLDRGISVGGISVLHALNVGQVEKTYRFFNKLHMDLRFLPTFASEKAAERIQYLLLSHEQIVTALKRIVRLQFEEPANINVHPVKDYVDAAIRYLTGRDIGAYHPADHEWALIINTNGDTYSNGDTYQLAGYMGNVFRQTLDDVFASSQYAGATAARMERARVCETCPYYRYCDQLSLIEAIDSERAYDVQGNLVCSIARPMIQFIVEEMRRSSSARELLQFHAAQRPPGEASASMLRVQ
jgi:uncharacterized protein